MEASECVLLLFAVAAAYIVSQNTHWPIKPPVFITEIPNFLSHEECDDIARAAAQQGFVVSEVGGSTDLDPSKLDLESRRSEQTWFSPGAHPVADVIRRKTKEHLSGIDTCAFEDIQVARYSKGGYYKTHFDGDDCDDACPKDQRLGTMIVYLREPKRGGNTHFPSLNRSIRPVKGNAVFFWVADPETRKLYKETLHAGEPVMDGVKIIATQWIRSK